MTFAKGLEVLEAFSGTDRSMTIPNIAEKTGLNRTVARRLVLTLQYLGYLECSNRVYKLTPKILGLAGEFLQGRDIGKHVTPILRSYSLKLGEGISFAMLDGTEAIYVAHSPSDPGMITQGFTVGYRLPLHATGIGRVLVAFSTDEMQEQLLQDAPRTAYTEDTKIDLEDLRLDLKKARINGYALVANEFEQGVTSLAVPVMRGSALIGALGIVGPTPRFEDANGLFERILALRECAEAIAVFA
ncbi:MULTISPECIES: IclR family transcriptional regulator [unclassified Oceanobacter]|uniref:IclR family transcriptional regulator n=2 Tax=Gammaproteobacteria TaxID=1236 RepID=UPI0026E320B5|nr:MULTISPECIES: IclR family transcriptional regulator C-terminal domain-containing protein [unclassified Oceanobacter]MDO6680723.1 IclR family transcriptional regulator C-terminal domain-containing protein [Oceanobacter sp. 5_MG-2023]MDP2504491.1 IclR family transcriptional regulator C-terminal domain-containing protein [Oceanobacter sp. 3_MG-2023]MDP2547055.1 IclR family transcriptional regulator C-terminal domain-containing protein [Oceanobacter sp. 4_MG-2023]MDP2607879.1 IclR family transcr